MPTRDTEVRMVDFHGNMIQTLPEAQVNSMTWVLNDFGQMEFHQSTTSPGADIAAKLHNLDVEVQVWQDGALKWWGVPMTDSGGPGEQVIGCDGLFCYFEDFMIDNASLEWDGADQLVIARDLVLYAQSEATQAHRDKNIGVSIPSLSGVTRFQRYDRAEHPVIAGLLRDWTVVKHAFDFDIEFTEDGSRNFVPYYPRKGSVRNDLILEYGKNSATYQWNRSAVDMRTQTFATGGAVPGSDSGKIEQPYEDTDASALYGVIQRAVSFGNQMDVTYLLNAATKDVNINSRPKNSPSLPVIKTRDMDFYDGDAPLLTGDHLPVRIVDGYRSLEANLRVTKIQWNPDESLDLTLTDVDPDT